MRVTTVDFLGHTGSSPGLQLEANTVETLPRTPTLRSLIRGPAHYRNFLENL